MDGPESIPEVEDPQREVRRLWFSAILFNCFSVPGTILTSAGVIGGARFQYHLLDGMLLAAGIWIVAAALAVFGPRPALGGHQMGRSRGGLGLLIAAGACTFATRADPRVVVWLLFVGFAFIAWVNVLCYIRLAELARSDLG